MKKKYYGVLAAVLIVIVVFGAAWYFDALPATVVSGDYNAADSYPSNNPQYFYREVIGSITCEARGTQLTALSTLPVVLDGSSVYTAKFTCPDTSGVNGCRFRIEDIRCPSVLFVPQSPYYRVQKNNEWVRYTDEVTLSDATSYDLQYTCRNSGISPNYAPEGVPTFKVRSPLYMLSIDSANTGYTGYLSGSEGCRLVSNDATVLYNLQKSGSNTLAGVTVLKPGDPSKQITVGWVRESALGNMNPYGKYQGKDVYCSNFNGLKLVEKRMVDTSGTNDYYVAGNEVLSYAIDNKFCCGETCGSGMHCENYKCTSTPSTCANGQCNVAMQGGSVMGTDCQQSGGTFTLVTSTCGTDGCISKSTKSVSCCRAYCDQTSPGSYCDYNSGCLKITTCGDGACNALNGENCETCAGDCGACPVAGNSTCVQNCKDSYGILQFITQQRCITQCNDPVTMSCKDSCYEQFGVFSPLARGDCIDDCEALTAGFFDKYGWWIIGIGTVLVIGIIGLAVLINAFRRLS